VLLIALTTSCGTVSEAPDRMAQQDDTLPPKNRSGTPLNVGESAAVKLEPGTSRQKVQELLGPPDETSVRTYGTKTLDPWSGLEWHYIWRHPYALRQLIVVFEEHSNNWIVNSWRWSDF
jgi:hypothetical protein